MKTTKRKLMILAICFILLLLLSACQSSDEDDGSSSVTSSNYDDSSSATDDITPPSVTISINNGDYLTSTLAATLSLTASDDVGVTAYYVSETNTTPSANEIGWIAVSNSGSSGSKNLHQEKKSTLLFPGFDTSHIGQNESWVSITETESYSDDIDFTLSSEEGTKTVYTWVKDDAGNISNVSSDSIEYSVLNSFTSVTTGSNFACGLMNNGTVKCWGSSGKGTLGNGTTSGSSFYPVVVSNISSAVQVSAGDFMACAVIDDGTVKCWGCGDNGELGNGEDYVTNDGRYIEPTPVTVTGISNATQVATGAEHACALLDDGSIKCWGRGTYGQLGDGTATDTGIIRDSESYTGYYYSNVPVSVIGITNATLVAAGQTFTCALLDDSTIKCWGDNSNGQLGVGTDGTSTNKSEPDDSVVSITTSTQIGLGEYHTCAVLEDGTTKCWGLNRESCLGSEAASSQESSPVEVYGISNATMVKGGSMTTCALLEDGSVKCWGDGLLGNLGNGDTEDEPLPVFVSNISTATQIDVGSAFACALLSNQTIRCWGDNGSGQLGNGTYTDQSTPVSVGGEYAGSNSSTSNGTYWYKTGDDSGFSAQIALGNSAGQKVVICDWGTAGGGVGYWQGTVSSVSGSTFMYELDDYVNYVYTAVITNDTLSLSVAYQGADLGGAGNYVQGDEWITNVTAWTTNGVNEYAGENAECGIDPF